MQIYLGLDTPLNTRSVPKRPCKMGCSRSKGTKFEDLFYQNYPNTLVIDRRTQRF